MDKNLLKEVMVFRKDQENFMNILPYFNKKIKYLSYKLKYSEAETDLIIYLYELLKSVDQERFNSDNDLLMYINKCLKNKATVLFFKISKDREAITFTEDNEILDSYNCEEKNDEYSDVIFNDLISSLKPRQRSIIFDKFYLQLSDVEIAKTLKISRQAVNKTQRLALINLKSKLSI